MKHIVIIPVIRGRGVIKSLDVIADYPKGKVAPELVKFVREYALRYGHPYIVAPKGISSEILKHIGVEAPALMTREQSAQFDKLMRTFKLYYSVTNNASFSLGLTL